MSQNSLVQTLRALKGITIGARGMLRLGWRRLTQARRPVVLVLSIGGPHSGSAWVTERADRLGYDVIVVAPRFPLRELPWARGWKVIDFNADMEATIAWARTVSPVAVLSDHRNGLLPVKARLLAAIGGQKFGTLGPATSTNKFAFREAIDAGGVANLAWARGTDDLPEDFPVPAVVKPVIGTGSRGVALIDTRDQLLAELDARGKDGTLEDTIIEERVVGRQFDVEGVCNDGTYSILSVTEEHYEETDGKFPSSWFLFSPPVPDEMLKRIRQGAIDIVRAAGVQRGAFHCELRVSEDGRVLPIDYSNRYGYPMMVGECAGLDFIEEYVRTLLPEPHEVTGIQQRSVFQEYILDVARKPRFEALMRDNPDHVIEARMLGSTVGGVWTNGRVSLRARDYDEMHGLLARYDLVPALWSDYYPAP